MIITMTTDHRVLLRSRLREAVTAALGLDVTLDEVIHEPSRLPRDGGHRGRANLSQPPWNAAVANLVTDLHAWSREAEATLRRHVTVPDRSRGSSSRNTRWALEALPSLAEASPDTVVAEQIRWLESWSIRARVVLGEQDQPRRLPRQPGAPEPRCPFCRGLTLRFWASRGQVRCIDPTCVLEDGRRPTALMEYSAVALDWVLAWNDGVVGIPA